MGTYNPQESEEGMWALLMLDQLKQAGVTFPLNGPLDISLLFSLKRPASHFGSGKNAGRIKQSAPMYPTGRPDCDNMIKFVLDVLNKIGVWKDDAQVVRIHAEKRYADPAIGPSTEIKIQPDEC